MWPVLTIIVEKSNEHAHEKMHLYSSQPVEIVGRGNWRKHMLQHLSRQITPQTQAPFGINWSFTLAQISSKALLNARQIRPKKRSLFTNLTCKESLAVNVKCVCCTSNVSPQ